RVSSRVESVARPAIRYADRRRQILAGGPAGRGAADLPAGRSENRRRTAPGGSAGTRLARARRTNHRTVVRPVRRERPRALVSASAACGGLARRVARRPYIVDYGSARDRVRRFPNAW